MAKTLLDGVNEVLKRAKVINGDSGVFTTLTDSARQNYIDVAVQVWNESIDELFSQAHMSKPLQMAEATITLVTGDRDYALASDLVKLRFPFHDQTDGHYIWEWERGYHDLETSQLIPSENEGRPQFGAIRPTDGQIYFDRIPQAEENGDVYTYNYDKELELTAAASTMPFEDNVFRAMVPVVADLWEMTWNRSRPDLASLSFGRASRFLRKIPERTSWLPH